MVVYYSVCRGKRTQLRTASPTLFLPSWWLVGATPLALSMAAGKGGEEEKIAGDTHMPSP